MADPVKSETETVALRPMGQGIDEIREVRETETVGDAKYTSDGRTEKVVFNPKTADEANALRRGRADLGHRNLITWAGLILIFVVTLISSLSFLGITYSAAPTVHEDAKSLLLLVVGAVLGAVFGVTVGSEKDKN